MKMNENNHTPGPWHIQKYSKDKLFVNAEHDQIAHILHTETRGLISTPERRAANAHLIAAAPELLANLTGLLPWIELAKLQTKPYLPDADYLETAYAAICKAKGEA